MLSPRTEALTVSFAFGPASSSRRSPSTSRKNTWATALAVILPVLTGSSFAAAQPVSVSYTLNSLGSSTFQYNYTVSGSFSAGDDLAIYFPLATSSSLMDLGTGGSDWTTFVLQPDATLPADGEFDLVANVDNPSLAPVFSASFVFSGTGLPGAQSFAVFDSGFNQVSSGVTTSPGSTSPVPEPGSLALLGTGALGCFAAVRRRLV